MTRDHEAFDHSCVNAMAASHAIQTVAVRIWRRYLSSVGSSL